MPTARREATSVELRLLGPVEVVVDGEAIAIGSAKQRAVLAVLALSAGTVVGADTLVDALWGDRPPPTAPATLRSLVARLRRTLDECGIADAVRLHGRDSGYVLDADRAALDVDRFEALCGAAAAATRRGDHAAAAADLESALSLWRGPALGEPTEADRIALEARRLDEARHLAVEELAAAALESGRTEFALAQASALVTEHPMRERAWWVVMLAAYRAGRQSEALEAYQRIRRVLADELGIEPTPALRDLHERILRQDPALVPVNAAPNMTLRHNIPLPLTSFVGRSAELAELGRKVADARMVTLTGTGGAGKTRLALAWAARQAAVAYPDGVHLAELAPIREPELVAAAVAGALRFLPGELTEGGRPLAEALCAQLGQRRLLIVLDNCEHLVTPVSELCVAVLSQCAEVTILATSREVLGVPGELVYPVPPLSLPARDDAAEAIEGSDAGRLFCERARAADPNFVLTPANSAAVHEICCRLDGMPLALELAAARMRVLGPKQIAERLGERLRLLGAPGRGVVPRHQTLRAAIDWSHDLLSAAEQAVLARLSVFPGSFDLAAAEAVTASCEDTSNTSFPSLDLLARLVDKSLVVVARDAEETRFGLLETIREYAAEKLSSSGDEAATRKGHRDFYLRPALAGTRGLNTFGSRLRIVGRELDNYRAALRWSVEQGDGAAVLALGVFTGPHWIVVASDDEGWLEHAVEVRTDLDPSAAAEVRLMLAMATRDRGGSASRFASLQEESLRLAGECGDLDTLGRISAWFSELELGAGNRDRADELREASRAAFQTLGDGVGRAWCEHQLALIRLADDDMGEAVGHAAAAVTAMGPDPDEWWAPHSYGTHALVLALAGHPGSDAAAEQSVRIARGLPWPVLLAMSLTRAAQAAALSGAQGRARDILCAELLPLLRDLGFRRWVGDGLELTALVLAPTRPEAAITVLGSSSALRNRLGEALGSGVLARHVDACRVALMEAVGPDGYAERDRGGRAMSTDEALEFARACLQVVGTKDPAAVKREQMSSDIPS